MWNRQWRWPWSPVSKLEQEQMADRLVFRYSRERSLWGLVITASFLCGWTWVAFRTGWGWAGVLFGVAAMGKFVWHWKDKIDVTLTVTSKGFETDGNFGGGYQPIRWVQWKEITSVCYGRGTGGENDYSPEGLWVEGPSVKTCVLPGVEVEQAQQLAENIYTRFPSVDMGTDTEWRGLFGDGLVSFNLSGRP